MTVDDFRKYSAALANDVAERTAKKILESQSSQSKASSKDKGTKRTRLDESAPGEDDMFKGKPLKEPRRRGPVKTNLEVCLPDHITSSHSRRPVPVVAFFEHRSWVRTGVAHITCGWEEVRVRFLNINDLQVLMATRPSSKNYSIRSLHSVASEN